VLLPPGLESQYVDQLVDRWEGHLLIQFRKVLDRLPADDAKIRFMSRASIESTAGSVGSVDTTGSGGYNHADDDDVDLP